MNIAVDTKRDMMCDHVDLEPEIPNVRGSPFWWCKGCGWVVPPVPYSEVSK